MIASPRARVVGSQNATDQLHTEAASVPCRVGTSLIGIDTPGIEGARWTWKWTGGGI